MSSRRKEISRYKAVKHPPVCVQIASSSSVCNFLRVHMVTNRLSETLIGWLLIKNRKDRKLN